MKRFLMAVIMILMTAVCPAAVFAAENIPEEITAEAPAPETAVLEELPDSEELFEGYFNEQFYGKKTSARPGMLKAAQRPRRSSLRKYEQVLYDALLAEIKAVAAGEKTSTDFTIEVEIPELAGRFSAANLGVDAIVSNGAITADAANALYDKRDALINVEAVGDALRIDFPYELYWFDKTTGYFYGGSGVSASGYGENYEIYFSEPMTYSFSFAVSEDYAAANSIETRKVEDGTVTASFRTDSNKTTATKTAAANAKAVVAENSNLHDDEKIKAYKAYICQETEYNHAAADDDDTPYGDPWQLIWVFDGNQDTNVVCEGYSKAFQYLCDLTTFNAKVECRTVTGTMSGGTGAGRHMWNVLQIGGKNYLVDVTNSDAGTVGANGGLFMVGKSGNTHLSYAFLNVSYTYDSDTRSNFTDEERRLNTLSFDDETYVPDLDPYPGKPATCTEAGVKDYYSYEGSDRWFSEKDEDKLIENHTEIILPAAGHTSAAAVREKEIAATCEAAGSYDQVVYCTVCGEELSRVTKETDLAEHTAGEAMEENRTAATCTKKGSYDQVVYCTVCGKELSRVTKETDLAEHTAGEAVEENRTAATCTKKGSYDQVVYCTVCGEELSRVTKEADLAEHTAGEAMEENRTVATCTKKGSYDQVVYCTVCGEELSRVTKETDLAEHTAGEVVEENRIAATCTKKGSYDQVVYCTVCGEELSRVTKETDLAEHTAGEAVEENRIAATCTKKGSYDQVVYCTVCGEELSRVTKETDLAEHTAGNPVEENRIEATEENDGSYDKVVYCTVCGTEMSRISQTIPKHIHAASDPVIENIADSTCIKEGSCDAVVYCATCGSEISRETRVIEKKAHTPGAVTEENRTEATCEEDGSCDEVVYCTICKAELNREHKTIEEKLGHTPAAAVTENNVAATCTEAGSYDNVVYCAVCGMERSRETVPVYEIGHAYGSWTVSREATCSREGEEKRVCAHDPAHVETRKTAKLVHTPDTAVRENVTAASCTTAGSYASVVRCSVCKAVLSKTTKTIPAIGHKFGSWTYKDASSHSRVCANNSTHVETAAHSWSAGVVTKAPTTEAEGIRSYTCTVCGGTKTESIAKLNAGEPLSPEYAPALEQEEQKVLTMKGDEAPVGSSFSLLKLRAAKTTKKSVKLQWNSVKGASGYVIYGSPCGSKFKKIAEIKKGSAKSFTVNKLKKGKYYKFYIIATAEFNGQTKVLAGSKSIHIATAGGKMGNHKTLTFKNVKKNKLTLKVKKKFTVKTKLSAAKGVKVKKHRAVCFESSDPTVAVVTKKGKITAKKAGKCSIFVYAQNGIYKTIKLTVK